MKLNLQSIPRVSTITKEDFITNYFKPQKPVVIEKFIEDWPAYSKWSLDYMKMVAGDKQYPFTMIAQLIIKMDLMRPMRQ